MRIITEQLRNGCVAIIEGHPEAKGGALRFYANESREAFDLAAGFVDCFPVQEQQAVTNRTATVH